MFDDQFDEIVFQKGKGKFKIIFRDEHSSNILLKLRELFKQKKKLIDFCDLEKILEILIVQEIFFNHF